MEKLKQKMTDNQERKLYKVKKSLKKNWVYIVYLKDTNKNPFMMSLDDFGIIHKELPAYCQADARALWNLK